MIKVGIIGGSGYTGGELIRLLIHHPAVEIDFVYSTTRAGKSISNTHTDILGQTNLKFTGEINPEVQVVFLCLGHGNSKTFLSSHTFSDQTKVIDLSNDFRLTADQEFKGKSFVYGLPELFKTDIENANAIANPGCFATAIQLATLPLAKAKRADDTIHVNAVTGSTGAGVSPSETTHYSWRDNNCSWYKPFTHQHLGEIEQHLKQAQSNVGKILFLPQRGNFTRGIFATAYTSFSGTLEEAKALYSDFYKEAPFVHLSDAPITLKQVVNTNNCHLHLHLHEGQLLITAAIDNLVKGASGQAIQNMNLIFGWEETLGLQLKATVY